ncbi:hypothetical protein RAO22_05150, partial [Pediococcus acidilactici]
RLANTVSGYADKFVQKFGLNLQSTFSIYKAALQEVHSRDRATVACKIINCYPNKDMQNVKISVERRFE